MTDMEEVFALESQVGALHTAVASEDWLAALGALGNMRETFSDVAAEVALDAARAGYSQKRIALMLGLSPYALRGLKAEATR